MEFKQTEFEALQIFVKDVQHSVESVASTLSDIKASDRTLKGKLTFVETKCDKDINDLTQRMNSFQGNIDELSTRLREIGQNQIDMQCQLIKLNLNQNPSKFLRRTVSFDTADNVPIQFCNSKHDSGVNINTDHDDHGNFEREIINPIIPSIEFPDNVVFQHQPQYPVTPANRKAYQKFRCDDQFSSFSEESEKFNLASELLQHERTFCNNLSMIQSQYYEPLKNTQFIPIDDMKFIFCDVLFRFYEKHCILLHKIQELLTDWVDPPYPLIIELYSKTFTVHGTAARNYIFYSTAYNKIKKLVQTYFVKDSAIWNYLQNKNGKSSKRKVDLVELEFCLNSPNKMLESYIDIFERFVSTQTLESFKLLKIHKLINSFKKINEDVNRSLQFTLSSASSDNVSRLMKTLPKNRKRQQLTGAHQRKFNNEQYYGSLDMRKQTYFRSSSSLCRDNMQIELSALDITMNKLNEANQKVKTLKPIHSNTSSEPSLYVEQIVSYDTTGDSTPTDAVSVCTSVHDGKKKPHQDKNVSVFKNTVAAFFSKRKNNQRFGVEGGESLFGTWRKSKPRPSDGLSRRGSWSKIPPQDCVNGSLKVNNSTNSASSNGKQPNSADIKSARENCVVLAYLNKNSDKTKYFTESDDSTSTGVEI